MWALPLNMLVVNHWVMAWYKPTIPSPMSRSLICLPPAAFSNVIIVPVGPAWYSGLFGPNGHVPPTSQIFQSGLPTPTCALSTNFGYFAPLRSGVCNASLLRSFCGPSLPSLPTRLSNVKAVFVDAVICRLFR